MIPRDTALEMKVAKAVLGIDIMMVDGYGLGRLLPYAVDLTAKRDKNFTAASLGGAQWQHVYTEDGKQIELYCYPLPAYSLRIDDAWTLLQHLKSDSATWSTVITALGRLPLEHEAHWVAKYICLTILRVLTGEDYAGTVGADGMPKGAQSC